MDAFVPPQVIEQLGAFSELGGEHRLVSVGFVMVGGIEAAIAEDGPDDTADALGALVDDVVAAILPYGVTALHTDIAPDGFKFVLCAGAPGQPRRHQRRPAPGSARHRGDRVAVSRYARAPRPGVCSPASSARRTAAPTR